MMAAVSPQAPKLVARFGTARVAASGLAIVAVGLVADVDAGRRTAPSLRSSAPSCRWSPGMAITMTPLTAMIMAVGAPRRPAIGSAMNDTTREMGGALGVAVLGSLVNTRYTSELGRFLVDLPAGAAPGAESGLAGALASAATLPGAAGRGLATAARSAYLDGMSFAALVAAGIVLAAAVTAYVLLPDEAVVPATPEDDLSGTRGARSRLTRPTERGG